MSAVGSSPLTRGKYAGEILQWVEVGLIPAHAGKMCFGGHVAFDVRAHPRSRGENNTKAVNGQTFTGSSPLTRGK